MCQPNIIPTSDTADVAIPALQLPQLIAERATRYSQQCNVLHYLHCTYREGDSKHYDQQCAMCKVKSTLQSCRWEERVALQDGETGEQLRCRHGTVATWARIG